MDLQKLLQVLSPENAALAVVFVVPGYVALEVYSSVVAAERRNFAEELFRVVAVSLLNFVLFFIVIPLGLQEIPETLGDVGIIGGARLVLVLIITPVLLAGVAAGIYEDVQEASARVDLRDEVTEPEDKNANLYQEYFEAYRSLYPATKDTMRRLSGLAHKCA